MIKVGEQVPDFKFQDVNGEEITKAQFEGKRVLFTLHPLAFTSVCTDQMRAFERNFDAFKEAGIDEIIGVSVDAHPSKKVWGESISVKKMILVSDFEPKAQFAKDIDLFVERMGTSGRGTFVMGKDGKVEYSKEHELTQLPDVDQILEEVKAL